MFDGAAGKSTLGLSYGLTISEAILAPAMPSTTARAGGVYLPIIQSLAKQAELDRRPAKARRRFWCKRSFNRADTRARCA